MKRFVSIVWVVILGAGLTVAQDEKKKQQASNNKEGVSISAPPAKKDQMWEAKEDAGVFFKDAAVSVKNCIEFFGVEVGVQRLEPNTKWPDKMEEFSKGQREGLLKPPPGAEKPNFKECKLVTEDPKAKGPPGIGGRCIMHRIILTDQNDKKHELIQYFNISSEVKYTTTITFDAEGYKKYWDREGQIILASIKKFSPKKEK